MWRQLQQKLGFLSSSLNSTGWQERPKVSIPLNYTYEENKAPKGLPEPPKGLHEPPGDDHDHDELIFYRKYGPHWRNKIPPPFFTTEFGPLFNMEMMFRLLRINSGSADDTLQCSLHRVGEPCDYVFYALSYEWGSTGDAKSILVNGVPFTIRNNLWHFLMELRSRPEHHGKLFFIDAICINQTNIPERSAQVKLMGDIYSHAYSVYIWLGPHADGSKEALNVVSEIEQEAEPDPSIPEYLIDIHLEEFAGKYDIFGGLISVPKPDQLTQLLLETYKKPGTELYWKAICAVTRRSYWTRAWIIQEVILARQLLIFCGDIALSGKTYATLGSLRAHSDEFSTADTMNQGTLGGEFTQVMERWVARSKHPNTETSLQDLIEEFGLRGSTDPRDRVYALLGLVTKRKHDHLTPHLPVDYSIPARELIIQVLNFCGPSRRMAFRQHLIRILEIDQGNTNMSLSNRALPTSGVR